MRAISSDRPSAPEGIPDPIALPIVNMSGSSPHSDVQPPGPAEIVCVVSNRPQAAGLAWARERGIAAHAVDHKAYATREAFEDALHAVLQSESVELVVLAGFMRLMTPTFVERWDGRMINIHPSLLPLYPGLDTHARALADGVRIAGCTVHYVVAEVDAGPIIAQGAVPVVDGDNRLLRRRSSDAHTIKAAPPLSAPLVYNLPAIADQFQQAEVSHAQTDRPDGRLRGDARRRFRSGPDVGADLQVGPYNFRNLTFRIA